MFVHCDFSLCGTTCHNHTTKEKHDRHYFQKVRTYAWKIGKSFFLKNSYFSHYHHFLDTIPVVGSEFYINHT